MVMHVIFSLQDRRSTLTWKENCKFYVLNLKTHSMSIAISRFVVDIVNFPWYLRVTFVL
jgi:hypothetical protein